MKDYTYLFNLDVPFSRSKVPFSYSGSPPQCTADVERIDHRHGGFSSRANQGNPCLWLEQGASIW